MIRRVEDTDARKNQLGRTSLESSSAPMRCISRSDFCSGCAKSMIGRESLTGYGGQVIRGKERHVANL